MKTTVVKKMIAAACAGLATLGAWHTSSGARAVSPSQDDEKQARVKELFVQQCARCHGRDGRGKTKLGEIVQPPDFTDAGWWKGGVGDARMKRVIAAGKGEMPGFAKKLTRAEIASLTAYVREFAPRSREKR